MIAGRGEESKYSFDLFKGVIFGEGPFTVYKIYLLLPLRVQETGDAEGESNRMFCCVV